MSEQHRCAEYVYRAYSFGGGRCANKGTVFADGKWWCHIHSPEGKAERSPIGGGRVMFLCDKCHPKNCPRYPLEYLLRSYGPCEACEEFALCVDCLGYRLRASLNKQNKTQVPGPKIIDGVEVRPPPPGPPPQDPPSEE